MDEVVHARRGRTPVAGISVSVSLGLSTLDGSTALMDSLATTSPCEQRTCPIQTSVMSMATCDK